MSALALLVGQVRAAQLPPHKRPDYTARQRAATSSHTLATPLERTADVCPWDDGRCDGGRLSMRRAVALARQYRAEVLTAHAPGEVFVRSISLDQVFALTGTPQAIAWREDAAYLHLFTIMPGDPASEIALLIMKRRQTMHKRRGRVVGV